uniref:Histamine receptor H4 n=1 Tax=Jaculus jaculus TaxID=51337 RepID=A0A8C5KSU0_JACJA
MLGANITGNLPLATKISLAFLMSLIAFATMLGNALVILAFVVDKNLRHRSNYFFLNLAISDFFVGVISIPLYIPHSLFNWSFGSEICAFWLITDYLLCTASVYNVVLITYDRYQSVSNAMSYRAQRTGILKIVTQMVVVWILAFLVNGPMILASEAWKNKTTATTEECEPGFVSEWYILAFTTLLEFLTPAVLVAYFNVQIYWSLWKRGNLSRHLSYPGFIPTSRDSGSSSRCRQAASTSLQASAVSLHSDRPGRKISLLVSFRSHMNSSSGASKLGSLCHAGSMAPYQREHLELLRARKLAKSLAILLVVFTICWAPYSLFTIVLSTYPPKKRPRSVWYTITFWLQWFNSFVNPFLYPLCHKRFQKAFWKIFRVKKKPVPLQNRSISS